MLVALVSPCVIRPTFDHARHCPRTTFDRTGVITASAATAVIGAGPAGLATAIMLARRGESNVHVYERLPAPAASDDASVWSDTAKFYLIGLGGRGQKALRELDAWERVERCCTYVMGRKDWAPGAAEDEGVERIFGDDRPYKTAVIPRDRLAGVLREVALADHGDAITLHYDTELTSVRWDEGGKPLVTMAERGAAERGTAERGGEGGLELRYDLLVGADGAARALASAMEADGSAGVRVTRCEARPPARATAASRGRHTWPPHATASPDRFVRAGTRTTTGACIRRSRCRCRRGARGGATSTTPRVRRTDAWSSTRFPPTGRATTAPSCSSRRTTSSRRRDATRRGSARCSTKRCRSSRP